MCDVILDVIAIRCDNLEKNIDIDSDNILFYDG